MGRIGSACLLVSLKSNDRICFWCQFCICMGKESQKSALPTLFHFARVRAALQPHVPGNVISPNLVSMSFVKNALSLLRAASLLFIWAEHASNNPCLLGFNCLPLPFFKEKTKISGGLVTQGLLYLLWITLFKSGHPMQVLRSDIRSGLTKNVY